MNPAHTRDPEELPRALLHVHRLHRGAVDPSPGRDGRLALRRGASAVILGNGVVHHVGAPGTEARGAKGEPRGVRTTVSRPQDGDPDLATVRQHVAHLSYGFHAMHLVPMDEARMAILLSSSRHSIIPFMAGQRQAGVYSATFTVDDGALEDPSPRQFIGDIMSEVWPLEDSRCLDYLGGLLPHEASLGGHVGPEDVAGLVDGLNGGDSSPARLDTAFVSPSLLDPARRGQARTGHENVLRCAGVSIISSDGVPEGEMYVISSHRGPVFINGPTVIHCGEGELAVARYCAVHGPLDGTPGQGRGFRVTVGQ